MSRIYSYLIGLISAGTLFFTKTIVVKPFEQKSVFKTGDPQYQFQRVYNGKHDNYCV